MSLLASAGFKLDSREELCGRLTQADVCSVSLALALIAAQPWEQELIVMAEVFAYFRSAFASVVEHDS